MPQNFQVTNQQWTSSQSEHIPHHVTHVQIPQTESKPTTQRPRPGKFEVFNDLNSKSGSEVKTKSWNSQWQ
ncbi:MAG: hypothetical protein LWX56_04915 [Ignavibacteria bacterium]|nr:hypothetical protein [Ignavibacteria bacterium]